jgi:hypothetical protein
MRQRGEDAWELRVYQGIDPDTRRQRWLTKTVHGTSASPADSSRTW